MENKRSVGMIVKALDNLMQRNLLTYVRRTGLDEMTVMNGWILGYLRCNSGKEVYQKDLEQEFAIGRSTVTNIVKLMEKKGMIARQSVPEDARLKKLVITPKGIEASEKGKCVMETLELQLLEGVSQEEVEVFYSVMEKFYHNLLKQREEFTC